MAPVPPTGILQSSNSRENKHSAAAVPLPVPLSQAINPELSELLSVWDNLDESARRDLLNVTRSWAAGCKKKI